MAWGVGSPGGPWSCASGWSDSPPSFGEGMGLQGWVGNSYPPFPDSFLLSIFPAPETYLVLIRLLWDLFIYFGLSLTYKVIFFCVSKDSCEYIGPLHCAWMSWFCCFLKRHTGSGEATILRLQVCDSALPQKWPGEADDQVLIPSPCYLPNSSLRLVKG